MFAYIYPFNAPAANPVSFALPNDAEVDAKVLYHPAKKTIIFLIQSKGAEKQNCDEQGWALGGYRPVCHGILCRNTCQLSDFSFVVKSYEKNAPADLKQIMTRAMVKTYGINFTFQRALKSLPCRSPAPSC